MRLRLVVLVVGLCLFFPNLVRADELYTLSVDYSNLTLSVPNSTMQWQFVVPSILTTPTTITNFLSTSLGSGLSGCVISDVQIPLPLATPITGLSSSALADFASPCTGNQFTGAIAFFTQSLAADGVYNAYGLNFNANVRTNVLIGTLTISSVTEPSSISLLGTGLLALVGLLLFKSRSSLTRSAQLS
jgi:hypothetical protein